MSQTHTDIRRTLLFLRSGDQLLLAMKKRGFGAGKWNGVGGKLEAGETLEEALVRECIEEVGVRPTAWTAVAELDFVQDAETSEPWHMFVYAYIADAWDGEPSESEEMRPKWFHLEDIPYGDMWDDDEFWLPYVLDGKKIVGEFTFDIDDRLLTHDVRVVEELPHERS
jgi:8-oxo-dGTP pyrophosphatase MutT (NUDIX family)